MVVFGCKSVSSLDCYLLLSLLPMSFTFSALFLFIYLFIYFGDHRKLKNKNHVEI